MIKVCSPLDPTSMCDVRKRESMNGSFYWDERRQGYCATQLPGPIGLPILLDACPFCKSLLPGTKARRYWQEGLEPPKQRPSAEMDVTDGDDQC